MKIKELAGKAKISVLAAGLSLATLVGCGENKLSKYDIENLDLDSAIISVKSRWLWYRDASISGNTVLTEDKDSLKYVYYAKGDVTHSLFKIVIQNKDDGILDIYLPTSDGSFHDEAIQKGQERFDAYLKIIKDHHMKKVDNYFK